MKILILALLGLLSISQANAQYSLRASMGIDFVNSPSLNDFINQSGLTGGNYVKDFNTAVNFSAEFGYSVDESFQIGLEAGYFINSFNFNTDLGKFDVSYNVVYPTVLGYYVLSGTGYDFKFGGGMGLKFVFLDLSMPGTNTTTRYSNTGFGFILRAEGNTLLGGNVYANIGADLKYDVNGIPKNNGNNLYNPISRTDVNLNSISAGIRLGLTFYF